MRAAQHNFNQANELTGRNKNGTGGEDDTLVYDAVGNCTDDGTYDYI